MKEHIHSTSRRWLQEFYFVMDEFVHRICGFTLCFCMLVMPSDGFHTAYGNKKALLDAWGSPIPCIVGGFCYG